MFYGLPAVTPAHSLCIPERSSAFRPTSGAPYDSCCTRNPPDHYSHGPDHQGRDRNILGTRRITFAVFTVTSPHPMSLSIVYWYVFLFPLSFLGPYSYPDRLVTHTLPYLAPCDVLSSISDP